MGDIVGQGGQGLARPLFHQVQRAPQLEPLRFIYTGALNYIKGVDLLLQALDRVKAEIPFELVIVSGKDRAFLEQVRPTVSTALWERLRFRDTLTSAQVAQELAVATMMIFPTRADTSPNAVKEAVVAGVPVIASPVGGINDYVFPEENGLLFASHNLEACTAAIRTAARHPLFGRGQVTPAALQRVRAYLSPALMGQRFGGLYRQLAAQRS